MERNSGTAHGSTLLRHHSPHSNAPQRASHLAMMNADWKTPAAAGPVDREGTYESWMSRVAAVVREAKEMT